MSSKKLVRVGNSVRGKKLIPYDGNFDNFVLSGKKKYHD